MREKGGKQDDKKETGKRKRERKEVKNDTERKINPKNEN